MPHKSTNDDISFLFKVLFPKTVLIAKLNGISASFPLQKSEYTSFKKNGS
jgi:hypothetical protein